MRQGPSLTQISFLKKTQTYFTLFAICLRQGRTLTQTDEDVVFTFCCMRGIMGVMRKLKQDNRGLITMELIILIVMAAIIYLIYKKVQSAQH